MSSEEANLINGSSQRYTVVNVDPDAAAQSQFCGVALAFKTWKQLDNNAEYINEKINEFREYTGLPFPLRDSIETDIALTKEDLAKTIGHLIAAHQTPNFLNAHCVLDPRDPESLAITLKQGELFFPRADYKNWKNFQPKYKKAVQNLIKKIVLKLKKDSLENAFNEFEDTEKKILAYAPSDDNEQVFYQYCSRVTAQEANEQYSSLDWVELIKTLSTNAHSEVATKMNDPNFHFYIHDDESLKKLLSTALVNEFGSKALLNYFYIRLAHRYDIEARERADLAKRRTAIFRKLKEQEGLSVAVGQKMHRGHRLQFCLVSAPPNILYDKGLREPFEESEQIKLLSHIIRKVFNEEGGFDHQRDAFENLIKAGVFAAVFPLHQTLQASDRQDLLINFGSLKKLVKHLKCPRKLIACCIDKIRNYFGPRTAAYFSCFGYYTSAMKWPTCIQLVCFIFGVISVWFHAPRNDICGSLGAETLMCPNCGKVCKFFRLQDMCLYITLARTLHHPLSVLFSIVMSIFVYCYAKRYDNLCENERSDRELGDFRDAQQDLGPQEGPGQTGHVQDQGGKNSCSRRLWIVLAWFSVLLAALIPVATAFFTAVFRAYLAYRFYNWSCSGLVVRLLVFIFSASANFFVVLVLKFLNPAISRALTKLEGKSSEQDAENSYARKFCVLELVGRCSPLFHVAFVKGNILSVPGQKLFGLRPQSCEYGTCVFDLGLQVAIVMVLVEPAKFGLKWLQPLRRFKQLCQKCQDLCGQGEESFNEPVSSGSGEESIEESLLSRCKQDYKLTSIEEHFITHSYVERVVQYATVMFFFPVLPFLPLFAMMFNLISIRCDAYNCLRRYRRPFPVLSLDHDTLKLIIKVINFLTIVVNAFVIGFTGDLVPEAIYIAQQGSLDGFANDSLSIFHISDDNTDWDFNEHKNITHCRFPGYREAPCSITRIEGCEDAYALSYKGNQLLASRFLFVVFYGITVFPLAVLIHLLLRQLACQCCSREQRRPTAEAITPYNSLIRRCASRLRRSHNDTMHADEENEETCNL